MSRIGIDLRMFSTNFTGIGRVNYELLKYLDAEHRDQTYVCFLNQPEYDTFPFQGAHIEKVLVGAAYYSWQEQTIFLKAIIDAKVDLMHFTHFNNPILYGCPQMVTIHDMTLSFFPGKKMTSWLHRMAYHMTIWAATKKAKKIIAVSENTKKDIINELHIAPEKIAVCYEGVSDHFTTPPDPTILSTTKEKYKLTRPFFLYTGVWRDHKNVVGMIRAFHKLIQEKQLEFDLVITGKHNPHYPEVLDTIHELKLEDHIHTTGLVDEKELHALYYLSSVYVFPSFYEGFGIPPLEAITAGVPVASSNTSCMPEVCGPESVHYFDPYSIEDMADAMYRLATDKEYGKQLVQNGKKWITRYSWNSMGEETYNIYIDLCTQHAHTHR